MEIKGRFDPIDENKTSFNIGALLDIPTGKWVKGKHGEHLLLGGLCFSTGVCGPPNSFKSTLLHYMLLSAMDRIAISHKTHCFTFDTESNIHLSHMRDFCQRFPTLAEDDIIDSGHWIISDGSKYMGDEWYEKLRTFLKDKHKNRKEFMVETPFLDRKGARQKEPLVTFSEIDSLTEMRLNAGEEIMNKNAIGESSGSHVFMREGLGKAQMMHELPTLSARAQHYVLYTSHVGENNSMQSGPMSGPPTKQLQYLSSSVRLKGVTRNFLYSLHNLWYPKSVGVLWNKSDDKTPKYPSVLETGLGNDSDLNYVILQSLRSKGGRTGIELPLLLSQEEGVLPSLSEFHFLREENAFGFQGNIQNYQLSLCPDITLSRTTARKKIQESARLRRALNITAELLQIHFFHRNFFTRNARHPNLLCTPAELVKKLTDRGYNVDFLLDHTRGWWTYDNDHKGAYFLSTYDLLAMGEGLYHPYWLASDNKTFLPEYRR